MLGDELNAAKESRSQCRGRCSVASGEELMHRGDRHVRRCLVPKSPSVRSSSPRRTWSIEPVHRNDIGESGGGGRGGIDDRDALPEAARECGANQWEMGAA